MKGYITVKEFCEKYRKNPAVVSRLIKAGRLKAERFGWMYMIPEDEKPPADRRFKDAR